MKESNIKETARVLKALSNERRLLLVLKLRRSKEATVGELAGVIHLSFKATSKHLAALYAADIVEREQRSLQVYYRLNPATRAFVKQISNSLE